MSAERAAKTPPDLQTNISRVVRGLMGWAGMAHHYELAELLGVSRSGVTEKLNGDRRWTVEDLQRMSAHFGVSVSVFYADPSTTLGNLSNSGYKPAGRLELIDGKVPDQAVRRPGNRPLLLPVDV